MKQALLDIKPTVKAVFQHLHANPELSWKEFLTTEYLKDFLIREGFQVTTFEDSTGLVVTIGSGKPCVGLRTDMDALWQEVDGEFKANHSCGHDAHMTMAVGTLLLLKKLGIPKHGTLKVLFQPAEEKGTGALSYIDKGLVEDIDYLYGVHLRPIQEVRNGYAAPAILHGAAKLISGKIHGVEAHGARPHLGVNAIEVGAQMVQAIQAIYLDPMMSYSAKLTKFQAGGESANIIPGNAEFSIDVRAQSNSAMNELIGKVEHAISSVASLNNITIDFHIETEIAAAEVDDSAVELMKVAIIDTIGKPYYVPPIVTPGGEDFHFYTLKRPSIKATMLGLGCDLSPGLHHPDMRFNEESIITGIEILARTIIGTFRAKE
ncbi:M20 peptidase aminoacylase family protein [Psychrobacillus lasiicapitis]|uniref:Amidohydrolase n=1 Tax=Psychrobacillus lasiicapitis TaxID=1636719 RepID=A0A544T2T4_9BACI|nr:M20 peptidase aminoacylase family protein [Psychrobacillus lasiicapitis]TQR11724.1 amidohydrolase [Psychrobacillus lasiicapitis]GGA18991.1 amidohydrolase AmhX [Psychrobacillus lasiicapitis]